MKLGPGTIYIVDEEGNENRICSCDSFSISISEEEEPKHGRLASIGKVTIPLEVEASQDLLILLCTPCVGGMQ